MNKFHPKLDGAPKVDFEGTVCPKSAAREPPKENAPKDLSPRKASVAERLTK